MPHDMIFGIPNHISLIIGAVIVVLVIAGIWFMRRGR
jgi:hypothetical protein